MAANAAAGKAFEGRLENFATATLVSPVGQVSVQPYDDNGDLVDYKLRLDQMGFDPTTGNIVILEGKASDAPTFTDNQEVGIPLLERNGAVVVGNAGGAVFPAGTRIPPTLVKIITPSVLPPPY